MSIRPITWERGSVLGKIAKVELSAPQPIEEQAGC